MTELCDLSAVELRRLVGRRKVSPVELLAASLDRIEATNPHLNAIVAMDAKAAREAAKRAEKAVKDGDALGVLHGLPIGVKDLQATRGLRTTWGSLLFKEHVPLEDEASVANVRAAGGIILAKTNTPEFGAGANTRNRVYGATGNPFDPILTCAGSSGGSAVALAAGQVPLATGSDYGGSLRTPASFCGVVGFRPSPGMVPAVDRAAQLMPWGVTGPMGRTVADAYLLLQAQLDIDRRDIHSSADSLHLPDDLLPADLASIRMAYSADLGCAPVAKTQRKLFLSRMKEIRGAFHSATETAPNFAGIHEIFDVFRGISFVAQHHERLLASRDQLDTNVIDNTERGLKHSMAEVARAHVEQTRLYQRVIAFFRDHDVLIAPGASVQPFPHEQLYVERIDGQRMENYMRWLTIAYAPTMALCCVVCLPCGVDSAGLPFGIQIIGRRGADAQVLEVALALEQVLAANPATARPLPDLRRLQGDAARQPVAVRR